VGWITRGSSRAKKGANHERGGEEKNCGSAKSEMGEGQTVTRVELNDPPSLAVPRLCNAIGRYLYLFERLTPVFGARFTDSNT